MTMTETADRPAAPAKPTAKKPTAKKPKRRRARRAAAPAKTSEFPGMTAEDCCETCSSRHCIISGVDLCGHPFKGGLQPSLLGKSETLARFNRAKKALGKQKLKLPGE